MVVLPQVVGLFGPEIELARHRGGAVEGQRAEAARQGRVRIGLHAARQSGGGVGRDYNGIGYYGARTIGYEAGNCTRRGLGLQRPRGKDHRIHRVLA